jgi:hypothetical protein
LSDVYKIFLKPLLQVFRPETDALSQKSGDRQAWTETYKTTLGSFSEEAMQIARDRLLSDRKSPFFPLPAECVSMCREATAELIARRKGRHQTRKQANQSDWERRSKIADELFAEHPDAEQSLREEWWWRLWSLIQEAQRLPDVHETKRIKAKGIADHQKFLEDIKGNQFAVQLKSWRNNAHRRISDLIVGKPS